MKCDNNVCYKPTYTCEICGSEYNTILDRAHCEIECAKKLQEEKKAAEKSLRKEAVDEAFENLHKLVTAYVKDYGHYEYNDGGEDTNFYWPSKTWHRFW